MAGRSQETGMRPRQASVKTCVFYRLYHETQNNRCRQAHERDRQTEPDPRCRAGGRAGGRARGQSHVHVAGYVPPLHDTNAATKAIAVQVDGRLAKTPVARTLAPCGYHVPAVGPPVMQQHLDRPFAIRVSINRMAAGLSIIGLRTPVSRRFFGGLAIRNRTYGIVLNPASAQRPRPLALSAIIPVGSSEKTE